MKQTYCDHRASAVVVDPSWAVGSCSEVADLRGFEALDRLLQEEAMLILGISLCRLGTVGLVGSSPRVRERGSVMYESRGRNQEVWQVERIER